jgi:hypothetical protein
VIGSEDALQRAQLQILKEPLYRHPMYWAPFLLINNCSKELLVRSTLLVKPKTNRTALRHIDRWPIIANTALRL